MADRRRGCGRHAGRAGPAAGARCRPLRSGSLARARQPLDSAATLLQADPDSASVLAYDAARHAGTAVLAQQGLRATVSGGHIAVERVLRAQFTPGFADFHVLRRRRIELETRVPMPPKP